MQTYDQLFLGGELRAPHSRATIDVVSPVSEQVIGRVPDAAEADVEAAVGFARDAFDRGPWPLLSLEDRLGRVQAFAAAIRERTDEFADVLCAEQGLPRRALPAGQVAKAIGSFEALIDIAGSFPWEQTRPGTAGRTLRVRHVAVGVVAAIVPWNAPLFVAAMKLAPALVAGNTVVLKPPLETPLHTYVLAEAATAAGLPAGAVNIVPAGPEVSEALVRHRGVDKVSFTGSTAVGRKVGAICGDQIKRCTLELGGKSAAVVLEDFALTAANVKMLVAGVMINAGQVCAAQTRVLAPRSRYKEIVDAMAEVTAALKVGDPSAADTDIGPLISRRQRDRVEKYLAIGVDEGASLITGGGRPDIERGWYVQPTVFADVSNTMTIAREEIFGPVAALIPYDDEDDAIALANDSDFGLAGAVWTSDPAHGEHVAGRLRTGSVAVNSPGALDAYGPFGGFKQSGIGREGGPEALHEYTEYQTIVLSA
jgi:aldehyde dehydrogenase (NAD+)